jgi:hypothetical protein
MLVFWLGIYSRSVRSSQSLDQILPALNPLVLLPRLLVRSGQRLNHALEIRIAKVRHRVPRRIRLRSRVIDLGRRLHHAVLRALDRVVGPPREQIPRVDDDGARYGRRIHEGPLRRAHLQATPLVLKQQRERAVVAVLAGADLQLSVVALEHALRHAGVVQQPQSIIPAVCKAVEPALVDAHAHRDRAHQLHVQVFARVVEGQHDVLERLRVVVALHGRPHVRHARLTFPPDLQRLLEVRHRAQLLHLALVLVWQRHLLAAVAAVSAVRLGGVPRQRVLLCLRAREELRRVREDGGDGRGGDGVVGEVDEAGGLEAGEDGLGGLLFLGGGAAEEGGEVDELGEGQYGHGEVRGGRAYGDDEVVLRDCLGDVDVCHCKSVCDWHEVSSVRKCHGGRICDLSDAAAIARVEIGMRERMRPPSAFPAVV